MKNLAMNRGEPKWSGFFLERRKRISHRTPNSFSRVVGSNYLLIVGCQEKIFLAPFSNRKGVFPMLAYPYLLLPILGKAYSCPQRRMDLAFARKEEIK